MTFSSCFPASSPIAKDIKFSVLWAKKSRGFSYLRSCNHQTIGTFAQQIFKTYQTTDYISFTAFVASCMWLFIHASCHRRLSLNNSWAAVVMWLHRETPAGLKWSGWLTLMHCSLKIYCSSGIYSSEKLWSLECIETLNKVTHQSFLWDSTSGNKPSELDLNDCF